MFEGKGEAIVYGCQLDDGFLYYHPVCVLERGYQGNRQKCNFTYYKKNWWNINILRVCTVCILTLFPTESMGQSYFSSQLSFPLSAIPNNEFNFNSNKLHHVLMSFSRMYSRPCEDCADCFTISYNHLVSASPRPESSSRKCK